MNSRVINSPEAPEAIGPYSHAIRAGDIIFLSGQLPVDPKTGNLVGTDPLLQARQVFVNLRAVANTAGGDLGDIVKLTIYLSDLRHFAAVNEVMTRFFTAPYPARATIGVAALPKDALIEVEAVMVSGELRFN
ncbi:MAG: reactive intermediate/imine deaminase [Gammaproteobacteria bacterium RIFCSPLOWO2_02_FULL_56_15]|nr:MAG: reactive intermediate/imine deaminase [Gammaproteobacteria bacterium RIFCSPLOWO2_02_FULL_56_15]